MPKNNGVNNMSLVGIEKIATKEQIKNEVLPWYLANYGKHSRLKLWISVTVISVFYVVFIGLALYKYRGA
jgi:hypothetical protein